MEKVFLEDFFDSFDDSEIKEIIYVFFKVSNDLKCETHGVKAIDILEEYHEYFMKRLINKQ